MAGSSLTGLDMRNTSIQEEAINEHFADLDKLAINSTDELSRIQKFRKDVTAFLDNWRTLLQARQESESDKVFFATTSSIGIKALPLMECFKKVNDDSDELLAKYTPIADEFHPRAVKAREKLRYTAILAMLVNVLLVIPFGFLLNKSAMQRIQFLINNMKAYADGKKEFIAIRGEDELHVLDSSFRSMYKRLELLDELKRSMRAMVSHDLRSPLAAVTLRIDFMLDAKQEIDAETRNDLRQLKLESKKLHRLANTLLDIDKMDDGSLQFSLQTAAADDLIKISIESVMAELRAKSVSIKEELDEDCFFLCDKERVVQVIINLLSNTIKSAPANSEITVRLRNKEDKTCRCEIHNRGPVISANEQEEIFNKFNSTEKSADDHKGSGLGLYICKKLITAQNGNIGYEPSSDGGGCFWFELAQHEGSEQQ
jgi:signal transduction histidine kinase